MFRYDTSRTTCFGLCHLSWDRDPPPAGTSATAPNLLLSASREGHMMKADGTWNTTMNTPMGAQAAVLDLRTEGDTLSGSMNSPQGNMDFTDGKVDGDQLTWNVAMTQPMPMTLEFSATVDGDSL